MFELANAKISRLSIHFLDHEAEEPKLHLTEDCVSLTDEKNSDLIRNYTLSPFKNYVDYRCFIPVNGDLGHNPIYTMADQLFNDAETFHETSQRIGKQLFQSATHHAIKSGDLLVTWITDVMYEDEVIDAIGIFKSENKDDFMQLLYEEDRCTISANQGININKVDKGCIIFNTAASQGYVVASLDRTSKNMDTQYWHDTFLKLTLLDDAFHQTQQYLNMAQTYVSHQLAEDFKMNKGDQVGILHEAGQFFKKNESYNQDQFETEVLGGNPEVITSFQNYKKDYARELEVEMPEQFAISNLAVKRSAKDFKSVLKLDKNFHVYIHGDRQMIEHGIEPDGRKYYKLFYDQEQ